MLSDPLLNGVSIRCIIAPQLIDDMKTQERRSKSNMISCKCEVGMNLYFGRHMYRYRRKLSFRHTAWMPGDYPR